MQVKFQMESGKMKQDIVVDASGGGRCVLWEEKIRIWKGECYELKNFVVKEYGTKFLSMAKEGCEIITIVDIRKTAPDELLQMDSVLIDAEIVGSCTSGAIQSLL